LVHAGNEDCPDETDDPSTEGRRRHRGIIRVGNRRTDFWIWGFILKRKGGWVKVWVVVFIDSNALLMLQNLSGASTLQPRGEEIENKKITDLGATKMIRTILIELDGPLFFICQ
jgi:hypothetical protein